MVRHTLKIFKHIQTISWKTAAKNKCSAKIYFKICVQKGELLALELQIVDLFTS